MNTEQIHLLKDIVYIEKDIRKNIDSLNHKLSSLFTSIGYTPNTDTRIIEGALSNE